MASIKFNKKNYLVGLRWYLLEAEKKGAGLAEAKRKAMAINATRKELAEDASNAEEASEALDVASGFLYTFAQRGQFALTDAPVTFKEFFEGTKALAPIIAQSTQGNCAYRFSFPEGDWVVVVSDHVITPSGDTFYVDKREADRAFATYNGSDDYTLKEHDEAETEEFIHGAIKSARLHQKLIPLGTQRLKATLGVFALVGVLVIAGALLWHHHKVVQKAQEKAQMAKIAAQQRRAAQERAANVTPKWQKAPPAASVLARCAKSMRTTSVEEKGWSVERAQCTTSAFSVSFKWNPPASFVERPKGVAFTRTHPNKGERTVRYKHALSGRGSEALKPVHLREATAQLFDYARLLGAKSVKIAKPPTPKKHNQHKPTGPPKPLQYRWSFSYSMPFGPWNFAQRLGAIPGITVNTIRHEFVSKGTWNLEGYLYAYP
jgi:hypothetical protein